MEQAKSIYGTKEKIVLDQSVLKEELGILKHRILKF